jgi:hypothetical protein
VSLRAGLDAVEKSLRLCRERNPGRLACSPSLYRLSYPGYVYILIHKYLYFSMYFGRDIAITVNDAQISYNSEKFLYRLINP